MSTTAQDRYHVTPDGLRLFYRDYPGKAATPVVCLPGLTRNSRDFADLAAALSPAYRVLTPDFRGRGRSAWDPAWQNYHPGTYLQDVLALIAHEKLERVVIVGTSLGGIVGMLLGATAPQRLAALVLNDVGPEVGREAVARIAEYVGRSSPVNTWEEAASQARETYGAALPDFTHDDWLSFARRAYRAGGDGVPVLDMDPRIGDAVRMAAGAGPAPDLWGLWKTLAAIPLLIIRGERSDVLSEATLARMLREAPRATSLIVPNRGHAPTLDEPICVAAIRSFLAASGA